MFTVELTREEIEALEDMIGDYGLPVDDDGWWGKLDNKLRVARGAEPIPHAEEL